MGVRAAAAALDLDFIPLVWESYDIALPGSALPLAQPLIGALIDDDVRHAIDQFGGYDTTSAGEIQSLADPGGGRTGWRPRRPLLR